jgi:hypothetical protein
LGVDLSAGSGATVLIPDCRLAPEHAFPAAEGQEAIELITAFIRRRLRAAVGACYG